MTDEFEIPINCDDIALILSAQNQNPATALIYYFFFFYKKIASISLIVKTIIVYRSSDAPKSRVVYFLIHYDFFNNIILNTIIYFLFAWCDKHKHDVHLAFFALLAL